MAGVSARRSMLGWVLVAALAAQAEPAEVAEVAEVAAPRSSASVDLYATAWGDPTLEYEYAFLPWASVQVRPMVSVVTSPTMWDTYRWSWNRLTGGGLSVGLRGFPLSRRAPRGWFFGLKVGVVALSLNAAITVNTGQPSGDRPGDGATITLYAEATTGYQWVFLEHFFVGAAAGVHVAKEDFVGGDVTPLDFAPSAQVTPVAEVRLGVAW